MSSPARNHSHGHGIHSHGGHSDARHANRKKLWAVFILTAAYFFVEVIGGLLTNSLALLSDAGHMFSDIAALSLALLASWFAEKPATTKKTFGYARSEVLAAFINASILMLVSVAIVREAVERFGTPHEIKGGGMLVIASIGLVVNLVGIYILSRNDSGNINLRGAYLHVIGDALGSVGAIAAGLIIIFTGWMLADTIISIFIAILILYSAWRLLWDSVFSW